MESFQDFASKNPDQDPLQVIKNYRDETALGLLRDGQYDDNVVKDLDQRLLQHAVDSGIDMGATPEEQNRAFYSRSGNSDDTDLKLVSRYSEDEAAADAARTLMALRDPKIRDQYGDNQQEYQSKLEAAQLTYNQAAPLEVQNKVKRTALDSGELGFAKIKALGPTGGEDRLDISPEMETYAGNDQALASYFEANPSLDRSQIGEIRQKLQTPDGYNKPLFRIERQQDFLNAFGNVANTDPNLKGRVSELKNAMGRGSTQDLEPTIESLADSIQDAGFTKGYTRDETKDYLRDYLKSNTVNRSLDSENVDANLRVLSTGEVVVPNSVMTSKALFDRTLAESKIIPASQKDQITRQRESVVAQTAPEALRVIASRRPEFTATFDSEKQAGKTDVEILDAWTSDPKNQSTASEWFSGVLESPVSSTITLMAALPALAGNETAASMIRYYDKKDQDRKQFANLFGKDLGVGFDIATNLAPAIVDVFVTKGAMAVAKATVGAAARAAVKPVLRGFFGATLEEGTRGMVNNFAKGLAENALETGARQVGSTVEAGALKEAAKETVKQMTADQVINAAGRDVVAKIASTEALASRALVNFTRGAGSSYVSMHSTLDGMTKENGSKMYTPEQVRDMSLKHGIAMGAMTALTTEGFSLLGAKGIERIFDGGLNRKQLTGVFNRLKTDWDNMAPSVREGLDMTSADAMLASMMTKAVQPLWKIGVEGAKGEVPEEMTQQFLEDILTAHTTGEKFDIDKSIKGALYAGFLGGVTGGIITTGNAALGTSRAPSANEEMNVRRAALLETARKLDSSNAPETAAAVRDLAIKGLSKSTQENLPEGATPEGTVPPSSGQGVAGETQVPEVSPDVLEAKGRERYEALRLKRDGRGERSTTDDLGNVVVEPSEAGTPLTDAERREMNTLEPAFVEKGSSGLNVPRNTVDLEALAKHYGVTLKGAEVVTAVEGEAAPTEATTTEQAPVKTREQLDKELEETVSRYKARKGPPIVLEPIPLKNPSRIYLDHLPLKHPDRILLEPIDLAEVAMYGRGLTVEGNRILFERINLTPKAQEFVPSKNLGAKEFPTSEVAQSMRNGEPIPAKNLGAKEFPTSEVAQSLRSERIKAIDEQYASNIPGQEFKAGTPESVKTEYRTLKQAELDFGQEPTAAAEAPTETPVAEPAPTQLKLKAKQAKDFKDTGNYDVETPQGIERIFKDPEDKMWYRDNRPDEPQTPFTERLLGTTKTKALEELARRSQQLVETNKPAEAQAPPEQGLTELSGAGDVLTEYPENTSLTETESDTLADALDQTAPELALREAGAEQALTTAVNEAVPEIITEGAAPQDLLAIAGTAVASHEPVNLAARKAGRFTQTELDLKTEQSLVEVNNAIQKGVASGKLAPVSPSTKYTPESSPTTKDLNDHGFDEGITPFLQSVARGTSLAIKSAKVAEEITRLRAKFPKASDSQLQKRATETINDQLNRQQAVAKLILQFPELLNTVPITKVHNGDLAFAGTMVSSTGQILINTAYPGPRGGVDTVLHELVHAATVYSINKPTPAQAKVLARLDTIRQTLATKAEESGMKHLKYGLSDMHEFFTHFMTSPEFQRGIDKLTTKGQPSLVQTIVRGIRDLLQGKVKGKQEIVSQDILSEMLTFTRDAATEKYGPHANTTDGGVLLLPAYHGTPHEVDEFSTEKIGTGEGVQAFGYGLYFAENKKVAEWYRDNLTRDSTYGKQVKPILDGVPISEDPNFKTKYSYSKRNVIESLAIHNGDVAKATEAIYKRARILRYSDVETKQELAALKEFAGRVENTTQAGNLYKVEILPNKTELLDWDKSLSEQNQKVQDIITKSYFDYIDSPEYAKLPWGNNNIPREQRLAEIMRMTGAEHYSSLVNRGMTPEAASKLLSDLGIPGIRYFDNLSRNLPFTEIRDQFLQALPENAEISDVETAISEGTFNPQQEAFLKALGADDWLGFEYPAQAISAALSDKIRNWDPSPELIASIEPLRKDSTRNFVIFDAKNIKITERNGKEITPEQAVSDPTDTSRMGQLLRQPEGEIRDTARLNELENFFGQNPSQELIDANPSKYAELQNMRAPVEPETPSGEILPTDDNTMFNETNFESPEAVKETARFLAGGDVDLNYEQLAQDVKGLDTKDASHIVKSTVNRELSHIEGLTALGEVAPEEAQDLKDFHSRSVTGNTSVDDIVENRIDPTRLDRTVKYLKGALQSAKDRLRAQFDPRTAVYVSRLSRELLKAENGYAPRNEVKEFDPEAPKFQLPEETPRTVIPEKEGGNLLPSTFESLSKVGYNPEASEKTQINTTAATYEKIVRANAKKGMEILDFSAGRGSGTKIAKEIGKVEGFNVEGYEPFSNPDTRVIAPEYEGSESLAKIPANSKDLIINNAVLNVVPENVGREIVRDIYDKLKPNGSAFINVMGWNNIKNRLENPKTKLVGPREVVTQKGTFQKGYTVETLRELIVSELPNAEIARTSYGDIGFKITKTEGPKFQLPEETLLGREDPTVGYMFVQDGNKLYDPKEVDYIKRTGLSGFLFKMFGTKNDLPRPIAASKTSDEHLRSATETDIKNRMRQYGEIRKNLDPNKAEEVSNLLGMAMGNNAPLFTEQEQVRVAKEMKDRLAAAKALASPGIEAADNAKIKADIAAKAKYSKALRSEDLKERDAALKIYEEAVAANQDQYAAEVVKAKALSAQGYNEAMEWEYNEKINSEINQAQKMRDIADLAQSELAKVSPEMAEWAKNMRGGLDKLQQVLKQAYGVDHPMFLKIDRSQGVYLVRSYKIHSDPTLADQIINSNDPKYAEARSSLINFFEEQLADDMVKKLRNKKEYKDLSESDLIDMVDEARVDKEMRGLKRKGQYENVDDDTLRQVAAQNVEEQARLMFEDFILGHGADNITGTGRDGDIRTDINRFLEKKNVPEEIRNALQENTDPIFQSQQTFIALSDLIHSHRLLTSVTKTGIEGGWFVSKKEVEANKAKYRNYEPVVSADSKSRAYAPLGGYYTTPEIAEAFKAVFKNGPRGASDTGTEAMNKFQKFVMGMAGTSLAVTTMGSIGYYVRNPFGGVLSLAAQGHNPFSKATLEGVRASRAAAFGNLSGDAAFNQQILREIGLGILNNGATVGYTREMIKMSQDNPSGAAAFIENLIGKGGAKAAQLLDNGKLVGSKAYEFMGNVAEVTESFQMHAAFEKEVATLWEAKFGTIQEIEQEAARKVKLTNFSKSETSQGIKAFTRNPLSALIVPFARFKSEVPRVMVNTYKLGWEEFNSGNPVLKERGLRRMAAGVAVHGFLTTAVPLLLSKLAGIGPEEDKAIRAAMPEYAKNTSFFFFRMGKDLYSGDLTYANPFSFGMDPLTSTIRATMAGDYSKIPEVIARAATQDIFGENIVAGKLLDVKRNVDESTGLPIYLDTDDADTKGIKMAMHIWGAYTPKVLDNAYKAIMATNRLKKEDQPFYYTPSGIMLSQLLPVKPRLLKLDDMAYRAYRDVAKTNGQLWQITAPLKSPQGFTGSVDAVYKDMTQANRKTSQDAYDIFKGYEGLGMKKSEISYAMKQAGFSPQKIQYTMQGVGRRKVLDPKSLQKIKSIDPRIHDRWMELQSKQPEHFNLK